MVAALEQLSRDAPSEDTRSWARKMLESWRSAPQTIAVGVITAMLNGQLPQ